MTIAGRALRLTAGVVLAWWVIVSVTAPEFPLLSKTAALAIVAATLWRPLWGLVLLTWLAPSGALLAAAPARAAELFAWSLVAGWLLAVWRPLSKAGWQLKVRGPLALYAGALIASWLSLNIAGAAGVLPQALPRFLIEMISDNHLVLSSPEADTWTLLQTLAGIAVFCAAIGIARDDSRTVRAISWSVVASMTILGGATLLVVASKLAGNGLDPLLRYMRGERYSLPFADVNAAGSLYALAAVIALGYAWLQPARRIAWVAVLVILTPAIWLSGSRSAYVAIAAGVAVLAAARRHWQPTRRHLIVGASLFLAVMLAASVFVDPQSEVDGSAAQSANLRGQFLLTSARMLASAPVFGVGVGRYFERSAEFMTPELRELYGNENAHNYFAQQFAELGVVGGLLFVWLIGVVLSQGWRAVLQSPDDIPLHALFAGATAYVLTCATGHPLLVPEATLPFWAAFGVVAASSSGTPVSTARRALAIAAGVMLAAGVGRAATVYSRPADQPPEHGFHEFETTPDGAEFRWMTRHAVMYIPEGPGFLHLRLRAPGWPAPRPVLLETSIAGRVVDTHELRADESTTWDVPAPDMARAGFRRVDFRVNQEWFEEVKLGQRTARRPVSLMVEEITWEPLR